MTLLLTLIVGAQFQLREAKPLKTSLPPDTTLTEPGSHYAPIFAAKSGITVRTVYIGSTVDARAGKVPMQFSGPKRSIPALKVPALMKALRGTNTKLVKLCSFHPDHLIEIPVGKDVARVVTCFTCYDVHFTFRGKSILGSMGPGLDKVLDAVVPKSDRQLAILEERLTPQLAKQVLNGTPITYQVAGGPVRPLDGDQRVAFLSIISSHVRKTPRESGGPVCTIQFANFKAPMRIDFDRNSIQVPSGFPSVSLDWGALRKCLLKP